jgi:hypothetical protein
MGAILTKRSSGGHKLERKARWLDEILRAFSHLGGKAFYKDLYREIGKIRGYPLSPSEKADVRKEIGRHSSDSKIWQKAKNKRRDLFYSLGGSGRGYWARRPF